MTGLIARLALAATLFAALAGAPARAADTEVKIANFTFNPPQVTVKAGTTVTWTNDDDIPHTVDVDHAGLQIDGARHRRQVLVHIHDTGHLQILLLLASAHDRDNRGGGGDRRSK